MVGECIREKRPTLRADLANDTRSVSMEAARARGYRSAIALPLTQENRTCGAFVIYSDELHPFDEEETALLSELAADISFALDYIEKRERLDYLAYYDPLTGLPNRTLFLDRCSNLLRGADEQSSLAIMLIDIERFRHVNDTLGRAGGDELPRVCAPPCKTRSQWRASAPIVSASRCASVPVDRTPCECFAKRCPRR